MKQRKLVIGLLVMLAVLASGFTYAFWAGSVGAPVEGSGTVDVVIGAGNSVTSEFDLSAASISSGTLVPAGLGSFGGDVEFVTIGYDVEWNVLNQDGSSLDDSVTTGTLGVTYEIELYAGPGFTVEITDAAALALVQVSPASVSQSIELNDVDATELSFTVTLIEPDSVELYNLIKGAQIKIIFTFNVTAISTVTA